MARLKIINFLIALKLNFIGGQLYLKNIKFWLYQKVGNTIVKFGVENGQARLRIAYSNKKI